MAIQDDITIYPYSKTIRYTATSSNSVYSVQSLYSWLMDIFDEPGYMTYQRPMKYNTPTSYTMLNGWFLDNGDDSEILTHLNGGAIDTTGYATISDPVYMLDLTSTTDWVLTDKEKTIEEVAASVGPLLAYLNDYPVADSARIWVRDTNSHGTISGSAVIDMTADSGTGTGTSNGTSVTGDDIYTNLYTIESFPTDPLPQVYIYQNHPQTDVSVRIDEWSGYSNWDRGTIDIVFPVQLAGTPIDSGDVRVRVRQTGDTFTFVDVTGLGASRTPISTETAPDTVNITKGEHYLLYDTSDTGSFTANDVIMNQSTATTTPPTWYAEVTDVLELGDNSFGLLELRGLKGTITDSDAIWVGATQEAAALGTPGDTYVTYSAEGGSPPTTGTLCEGSASGSFRILRGVYDAGATGALVLQDDPTFTDDGAGAKALYYKDFSSGENVEESGTPANYYTTDAISTTLISGYNDITVSHINGTITANTFAGTGFLPGEMVHYDTEASFAIVVATDGSSELTLANVTSPDTITGDTITGYTSGSTCAATSNLTDTNIESFNFTLKAPASYSAFVEGGTIYQAGRSLEDIYAYLQYYTRDGAPGQFYTSPAGTDIVLQDRQEYTLSANGYTPVKPAPFGTLAGGVFFGAQGVWLQGMDSADANNVKLTDHGGTLREPDATIVLTFGNTRVDDVLTVYPEDGSTGLPDFTQYTSHNTNNTQSGSTFDRDATSFPNDTPLDNGGTFIVTYNSGAAKPEQHRYRYTAWLTTQLTLPTEVTGSAHATGSTDQYLVDGAGRDFSSLGVERGDIVRNTTDSGWGYVIAIDNGNATNDRLLTTQLTTAGKDWTDSDGFEINSLVEAYDNTDRFMIPYMDTIETAGTDSTPGSASDSVLYVQPRDVVIRARNVEAATEIQPFDTTGQITAGGLTASVIRTEDEVYNPSY